MLCVSLATAWSLAGAGCCAVVFVASLIPEYGSPLSFINDSPPYGVIVAVVTLALCVVLTCVLVPVPLLIAGRRHLRRTPAGARRVGDWTAVGWAGIVITVMLLYQFAAARSTDLFDPAWHALELCIGFLVVGTAMLGLLLGIPVPEAVPSSPGSAAIADE